jgi:NAD(P)-dependent dehydrogenase (short-subunit alcohol dehydrogenase family)
MKTAERTPVGIITGASRGIGRGIALHLARKGWNLTLAARSLDGLKQTAGLCAELGAEVRLWAGDLGNAAELESLVDEHHRELGSLDGLVLAAGVGSAAPLMSYPEHRLDRQLEVNFRAAFSIVAKALPVMRSSATSGSLGVSRIFLLSSLEGRYPEEGLSAYAASKAALISLASSINAEERRHRVAATAICPGFVDTSMSEWIVDRIPKAHMLTVDDVVASVEFVLSLSDNAIVPEIYLHRREADAYRA